jgi:hypothetical protein
MQNLVSLPASVCFKTAGKDYLLFLASLASWRFHLLFVAQNDHRIDARGAAPHLDVIARRKGPAFDPPGQILLVQHHQPILMGKGEGMPQRRIRRAENRRIRADPQCNGDDCDKGKARALFSTFAQRIGCLAERFACMLRGKEKAEKSS